MNTKTKTITKGKKTFPGRVYREQSGTYVSVTSVINPDGLDFPEDLLRQYGSRGTIVHELVEHYIKHLQVADPVTICKPIDIDNVVNGSLGLKWEDCNFEGFFQKYGHMFEFKYLEQKLINKEHLYAGRTDIIGLFNGDLAIMDIKTSGNYTTEKLNGYWMQLAAYAYCVTPVPQKLVIIPLNPLAEGGYEEPLVETNVQHHFEMFLEKLQYVKDNYIIPE